ncbi:MAG: 50S ribosomal protein L20 [Armatimonadetes bacterium]|nr:50S ribosomal protein L20 [Armatimonadota bacterium]
MPRVKGGIVTRRRHKKLLKRAEGYFSGKSKLYRKAHEQVMKSLMYAYRDRRAKKREFRRLWIQRISAGCRSMGVKYNELIHSMTEKGMAIDRKMLADLAARDPQAFEQFVQQARA